MMLKTRIYNAICSEPLLYWRNDVISAVVGAPVPSVRRATREMMEAGVLKRDGNTYYGYHYKIA